MLSDEQWAVLEPLIEICQPKGKTPPQKLRRTLSAILWQHQNGAKWRAVPEEPGPAWRAAQIFIRWARACGRTRRPPVPREGGSQAERDHPEALGRSRGGYGTKACVIADAAGQAITFRIAPSRAHELPHAIPLLERLRGVAKWVVGDRGYTSHRFREHI